MSYLLLFPQLIMGPFWYSETTSGGWIGICTTTRRYPVLKPACGLAAAAERSIAPKRQDIGSPPELARGRSAGGQPLHHHTTALQHHCTTLWYATCGPKGCETAGAAPVGTPLVDLRITRRQAPPLPARHLWT